MDTLRGNFDDGIDPLDDTLDLDSGEDDTGHDDPPSAIGTDERRMQVRAYNHWASLLEDRSFPSIEDLVPENLPDFGPYSVLLDFSGGIEDPGISFLGDKLAVECDAEMEGLTSLADVPARSLLSRITDHYMQILANQAPIGFEAEFVNQRGSTILYRGILLPFSSDDDTIDFIFGVINWKEQADPRVADELLLELDQAVGDGVADSADEAIVADEDEDEAGEPVANPVADRVDEPMEDWADGPAALGDVTPDALRDPIPGSATDDSGLPQPTFGASDAEDHDAMPSRNPLSGLADIGGADELGGFGEDYRDAYAVDYGDTEEDEDPDAWDYDDEDDEDEEEDTASILTLSRMIGPSPNHAATALAAGIPKEYEATSEDEVTSEPAFDATQQSVPTEYEPEGGDAAPYDSDWPTLGSPAPQNSIPDPVEDTPAEDFEAPAIATPELAPVDEDEMELGDWLMLARDTAEAARTSEDRSRAALYDAVSRAYDFSLEAAAAPDDFAEIVADAGLTMQDRAPMTPVVKLVFGANYDKTRLTEYAAVLSHAHRQGIERGSLAGFLRSAEGGLKGVVAEERRLKKADNGEAVEDAAHIKPALAKKLRALPVQDLAELPGDGEEFALVMVRRTITGSIEMVGEVPHDRSLVERAARKLVG